MMWLLKYEKALVWLLVGSLTLMVLLQLLMMWQRDRAAQYRLGYETASREMHEKMAVNAAKMREQMANASRDYQTEKARNEQKARIEYVQIEKIVERPVYRNVCFDDDGVQVINRAIAAD